MKGALEKKKMKKKKSFNVDLCSKLAGRKPFEVEF